MKNLYAGSIAPEYAETAREEMLTIRRELSAIAPSSVVWDVGRPKAKPPWGDTVGAHIQDLAHLFVTGTQRNLVDEVLDNLDSQIEFGGPLDVVPFDGRRH